MKPLRILIVLLLLIAALLVYQFLPAGPVPPLPAAYQPRLAVWMGVTWSMDAHDDAEVQALADSLTAQGVDEAYVYVSYLRADDSFNPTYSEAQTFLDRIRPLAPGIRWLAWVGVPVSITRPDGGTVANRLDEASIRAQIADFAALTVSDLGFDGLHLNAELIVDQDAAFLATLDAIRAALPVDAFFSTTAHALRPAQPVTMMPYPAAPHHWTPGFLEDVASRVDQIALMAYDSALPFPRDYRSWVAYQTAAIAAALAANETELLIGISVSEEYTLTHQTQAETLANGLHGFAEGLDERITGLALYPYWEISADEWDLLQGWE